MILTNKRKKYGCLFRGKYIMENVTDLTEAIDALLDNLSYFTKLRDAGVKVVSSKDDHLYMSFYTNDAEIADQLGFIEEIETQIQNV